MKGWFHRVNERSGEKVVAYALRHAERKVNGGHQREMYWLSNRRT